MSSAPFTAESAMVPKFIYLDLGKVLVDFDVAQMYRQIGEVVGIDPARVREVLFDGGLQREYELGAISDQEFYEAFLKAAAIATRPNFHTLLLAASDIFELNVGMLPLVAHLERAGHRLGILSNTCRGHWEHSLRRFRILAESFPVRALSYRVHAAKPDLTMFHAAAELAGVLPEEIFFTDDIAGHVAGARAAGFDAVQYTSTRGLAAELRKRGIEFDY